MITEFDDGRLRRLLLDYFGRDSRIRVLRRTPTFGSPVFVIDYDRGVRHFRTLGSFGTIAQVTEQSSMDLLYPSRLVFHYERLMSLALALCREPVNALLLGTGGAAMWRFIRAYLPDSATTLVDADEGIVAIAKRWFYLNQPVAVEPAERFLAGTTARFDAVLVDLYNSAGPAFLDAAFWRRCLDALGPGGCLAVNWADFATNPEVKPMAQELGDIAESRGLYPYYVTRRGFLDNLVQYVPTLPGSEPEGIRQALDRFVRARRLPDRGRNILENCVIGPIFPV